MHVLDGEGRPVGRSGQQHEALPQPLATVSVVPGKWYGNDTAGRPGRTAAGYGGVARMSVDAVAAVGGGAAEGEWWGREVRTGISAARTVRPA